MIIIIDTREQDGYEFDGIITVKSKLEAGDYSVSGLEDRVSIERKNIDDFVGTVIYQKERFHRELCALAQLDYSAIVVEASLTDILEHRYKSAVKPLSVIGAAVAIMVEYRVPIIFCDNRQIAAHVTKAILQRLHNRMIKNEKHGNSDESE